MILIVEDPFVSNYLCAALAAAAHETMAAGSLKAVSLLRERSRIAMLITNTPSVFMEFADSLPVLYIAAAPDPALAARFRSCRTLQKPFRAEALLEAVDELCGTPADR